jgi:hypothetical protein
MATTIVAFGLSAWLALLAVDGGVPPAPPSARDSAPVLIPPVRGGATVPADRGYQLRPSHDGSGDLLYEAPTFTARVARDGTTTFQDHPYKMGSWFPYAPLAVPNGRPSLQSAVRDLLSRRGRPPPPAPSPPAGPSVPPNMMIPPMSQYRPDPREACQYPRSCYFEPGIVVGPTGAGDLTEEIMRFNGQDPYRHEKAVFLAETRDMRQLMAVRAAAQDIRAAKADLAARMLAIACDERRSVRERRAVLQALGAELDGATPEAREAAASVKRFITGFFDGGDGRSRCPEAVSP